MSYKVWESGGDAVVVLRLWASLTVATTLASSRVAFLQSFLSSFWLFSLVPRQDFRFSVLLVSGSPSLHAPPSRAAHGLSASSCKPRPAFHPSTSCDNSRQFSSRDSRASPPWEGSPEPEERVLDRSFYAFKPNIQRSIVPGLWRLLNERVDGFQQAS